MTRRPIGPTPHSPRRLPRRAALLTGALALPLTLSGCSLQALSMSSNLGGTHPTKVTSSAAKTSASTVAKAPLVRGALATGSTVRTIAAGDRTVVVNYWTTQDVATWTSDQNVAIQLSAHLENSDTQHAVQVTRFKATLTVDSSADASVLRDDIGQFVLTPPYSYSSTLLIPAQPASARSATVSVQFDLLIETVPGSGQFFRQTVLDSFQLVFVPQTGTPTSTPSATHTPGASS